MTKYTVTIQCEVTQQGSSPEDAMRAVDYYDGIQNFATKAGRNWRAVSAVDPEASVAVDGPRRGLTINRDWWSQTCDHLDATKLVVVAKRDFETLMQTANMEVNYTSIQAPS